jgi:protein tyrosine phosphatase (PTP) superfamily phosphohydrolase (DUF442 family)
VPSQQFYQAPAAPCPNCNKGPLTVTPLPSQRLYQAPIVASPQPPLIADRQPTPSGDWHPAQPQVADSRQAPAPDTRAKLNLPEPMGTPTPPESKDPNVRENPSTGPQKADLAIEIPQFDLVYEKVASGLQPFPDGFALLKERGYKSVLRLQPDNEDGSAVRTDVESKGLKFQSVIVTPKTLNRELVDQFSKAIGDAGNQPIFVFDRKGQLAGALWYLHFRLADGLPEPEARKKAVRLGLNEETTGDNAEWWLAINQILRGA